MNSFAEMQAVQRPGFKSVTTTLRVKRPDNSSSKQPINLVLTLGTPAEALGHIAGQDSVEGTDTGPKEDIAGVEKSIQQKITCVGYRRAAALGHEPSLARISAEEAAVKAAHEAEEAKLKALAEEEALEEATQS